MESIKERIEALPWREIRAELHDKGFVIVKGVLSAEECDRLIAGYTSEGSYRKTIQMERYRFEAGEYI